MPSTKVSNLSNTLMDCIMPANSPEKKEVLLLYHRYSAPHPMTAVRMLTMRFFASHCRITAKTTTSTIRAINEEEASVER